MVAPGTAVREGIDEIVQGRIGALICIGDSEELSFLYSGGIRLDIDYTPALLYQVAKMDGAIILNQNATKICWANVQLMPDPTILSLETGTRHRTAERVAKQTDALVIAISPAPRRRLALPRRREVHPRGHPRGAGQGQPGARHARQVPHPARPGLHAADGARVRGRRHAPRRAHGAPARRARHPHGGGDRALHRRARHRGPADRDAARGDDGRRRGRQGRARARLPVEHVRRGLRPRARLARPPAAPGPARLRAARRAARLRPQAQHARPSRSRRAATASSGASRACPSSWSRTSSASSAAWTRSWPPTDAELEAVEGVGDMRAKDIREGLRRLQEINLVDRYLQT